VSGSRTPQERATTCTAQRQKLDALSCASADKLAFIRGSPHSIRAARAPSPAGCKPLPAGAACSTLGKESQELLAKRTPVPSFFHYTFVLPPSFYYRVHRADRKSTGDGGARRCRGLLCCPCSLGPVPCPERGDARGAGGILGLGFVSSRRIWLGFIILVYSEL
jgi:hypothetical protein